MNEYIPINISCQKCGKALSARANYEGITATIEGLMPLEYLHTETGSRKCTVTYSATPYDGWCATRAYTKAREKLSGNDSETPEEEEIRLRTEHDTAVMGGG